MKISTIVKKINFFSEEIEFVLPQKGKVREWIANIIYKHNFSVAEINYIFVSDEYLLHLNKEELKHDFYTDIITFPYHEEGNKELHSDIYISIDRVKENADENKTTFIDELHRVMIHGVLHLLGFDDHGEENIAEMRRQEEIALAERIVSVTTP